MIRNGVTLTKTKSEKRLSTGEYKRASMIKSNFSRAKLVLIVGKRIITLQAKLVGSQDERTIEQTRED